MTFKALPSGLRAGHWAKVLRGPQALSDECEKVRYGPIY